MFHETYFLFSFSQIQSPQISLPSGFYEDDFQVSIFHSDPEITILYTLDGSEPTIENLTGKVWNYKKSYPVHPGQPFGELFTDTLWTYEYTSPILIKNRTAEETVLAAVNTTIWPEEVSITGSVYKGTVIRARAYLEETQEYSETISRNYFVDPLGRARFGMPVIALSLNNDSFYSYEEGINVPGILFDEWRQNNPTLPLDGFAPANYHLRGSETEQTIHFNFFEENGEEILNHNAGLRINGNYTRIAPNKSFRLYAKNAYGENNFRHQFFKEYNLAKFKRLILRNSGNDGNASFFRDAFMHTMAKNLHFDIQESRPAIVFINGEYNGIRNIRERYDKKYFESIHDVPEESLDFLENEGVVKEGDAVYYQEMISFFENNSLQDDAVLEQAYSYLEPVNYTDYYATNIFCANTDWPDGNYLFWRHKISYNPNSGLGAKDGRFRWLLKDLDWGFFLHQRERNGFEQNTLDWATRGIPPTLIMRKLLENEGYKKYFITRFADLLNTTFKEDRLVSIIEDFAAIYESEIAENERRWTNYAYNLPKWQEDVERMKNFALNRPEFQREHLLEKFNLNGVFELTLQVSNENHGFIHLNTIDINPETDGIEEEVYPWKGIYFKNIPVTLYPVAKEGYKFSHWSGDLSSTEAEISLTLNEDTSLTANFIPETVSVSDSDFSKTQVFPNPVNDIIYIQSPSSLDSFRIYDLQGRLVKSGKIQENVVNLDNLTAGLYLLRLRSQSGAISQIKLIKK